MTTSSEGTFSMDQMEMTAAINTAVRNALRGDPGMGQRGLVDRVDTHGDRLDEHEDRIDRQERRWSFIAGVTAGSGLIGGIVGSFIAGIPGG